MILLQKQSNDLKKPSNSSHETTRQFGHLSPYHERVTMQKKYLQEKQHLRSILIMGHLQKMELNAINNRSIETIRKIKVAQEMSKKRNYSVDQKPQERNSLEKLKIDNRKKIKNRVKNISLFKDPKEQIKMQKIQQVYEKLIQDYVKQVSKEKILQKGPERTKVIEEACESIKEQMNSSFLGLKDDQNERSLKSVKQLNQKQKTLSHSSHQMKLPSILNQSLSAKQSQRRSHQRQESMPSNNDSLIIENFRNKNYENIVIKQKHTSRYRSVTDIQCNENLKQLQFEQNYLSKQRMRDEKLFLRKMRLIGTKNIRNRQKSSKLIDQNI